VAEAPLVRSTTAELGQVIEMKQIQALPLNGRFFQHLITMTPGAMPVYGRGDSAENASAGGARIATAHTVNGMPWSGNNYLLDGVVNNEMQNAYINITPPLEAIQEFKVQTNNPTAEFGVFGGGAVNLSIRSGTNEFHGSAFDYIRDDSLNSRSYFAQTKAPYNSHQFGGTLGWTTGSTSSLRSSPASRWRRGTTTSRPRGTSSWGPTTPTTTITTPSSATPTPLRRTSSTRRGSATTVTGSTSSRKTSGSTR